ncbi:Dabb family protein [Lysinibacillus sphaericus]|uniref:Stress responsive alpha-beta barrel domain-containing protein n=1 Tax=Lysinibacillus sphaericus OT4b.31 TaxID=1285586 RepID=R7ZEX5_LYSSH|nr:Dabb family protein [Lysinibacillus sphaericus]EON72633.1 stress responsive alpha-beta barrel domain-containing protein [Lysinibacillus sphaericus OT4b.31]
MIRHIVMWNHKDDFNHEEKVINAQKVKNELESLPQMIDGIISLNVIINPLSTSNREIILNSLFESEDHLQQYQVHPEHVRVSQFVGSVVKDRVCIDFEVDE